MSVARRSTRRRLRPLGRRSRIPGLRTEAALGGGYVWRRHAADARTQVAIESSPESTRKTGTVRNRGSWPSLKEELPMSQRISLLSRVALAAAMLGFAAAAQAVTEIQWWHGM